MLKDKPFFNEMAEGFLEFIGDSKLIAHNATFDINFINYELQEIGMEPLKNEVVDSLALAKLKFPGKKNNLDVLCERFNVDELEDLKDIDIITFDIILLSAYVYYAEKKMDTELY